MRQSQADMGPLEDNFFYAIMTAHGLGAFVSWAGFAVMGLSLWVLSNAEFPLRPVGYALAQATFWLMVIGTLGIVVTTILFGFAGSWVFLSPLPFFASGRWGDGATAGFSFSVLLVGVAIITSCLAVLHTLVGPGNPSERGGVLTKIGVSLGLGFVAPKRFPTRRRLPYVALPLATIAIDMIIATLPLAVLLGEMIVQSFDPDVTVDPLAGEERALVLRAPGRLPAAVSGRRRLLRADPRFAGRDLVAGSSRSPGSAPRS
jgi:cytochrome c oxidase subunit I